MSDLSKNLKQIGRVFIERAIESLEKSNEQLNTNVISRVAPATTDIKGDVYDRDNKLVLDSYVSSIGKAAYIGDIYSEDDGSGNLPVLKNGTGYDAEFNGTVGGALSGLIYNYDSVRIELIRTSIANGNTEEFKKARLILDPGNTTALTGSAKYYGDVYSTYYDGSNTDDEKSAVQLIDSREQSANFSGGITGELTGNAATATTAGTCSGNALTATTLETARDIGGISFDGSAAINLPGVNANQTDATLTWAGNAATATKAGTCSGNALTATTLETARDIGGVSFDGSADINLPGVNANQTDATLTWAGNAATASAAEPGSALANQLSAIPQGVPVGTIVMWSGNNNIPTNWALCDGQNATPDLRGRFVMGSGETYEVGQSGGEERVTLTVDEIPSHNHEIVITDPGHKHKITTVHNEKGSSSGNDEKMTDQKTDLETKTATTGITATSKQSGEGKSHNNLPPYYVLAYIMYVGTEP